MILGRYGVKMRSLQELMRQMKQETFAIYLASKDPRVAWYAKLLAVCVVAYLFSPIDLIPDFIPIIGYLDDLILVPLGIWLVLKMIPPEVLQECREKAQIVTDKNKPTNWIAAGVILAIWFCLGILIVVYIKRIINR